MKSIKILTSVLVFGSLLITSCDKDFEELNTNPNEPTTVPSGLLLADVVRNTGNYLYSTFFGGDMGSCWSQQWAKVNYEDEERYKVRGGVIEDYCWKGLYEDVIADARSMEKIAQSEGNDINRGIAIVMQAYGYSILTEIFGDVPFSEACQGEEGIISPIYDKQEDIYTGIFAMLDSANLLLSSSEGTITPTADLVYGGDHKKWQKFANSLKFRLLMRISHKVDVKAQLQDIVSNRAIFESNNDDAGLRYLAAYPNANPIYESVVYGTRYEYKVNSVMIDMLTDLNDPRLPVYAQKNSDGVYRGKPAGIQEVPNDEYNYDNVSAIGEKYLDPEFPGFMMTYSELMFLMAEAAHKSFISGNAESYYNAGIAASFEFNGVSDGYADYIAQSSVAYTPASGLQKIAEQNWMALYCQGIESWTEWRRTKFPKLEPAIDAVSAANGEIPSRYTYPGIEQSVNAGNYQAAKTAMGGDELSTKFWWLKP